LPLAPNAGASSSSALPSAGPEDEPLAPNRDGSLPLADREDEPIATRRTRRVIRLPPRFRDDRPQPLTALPSLAEIPSIAPPRTSTASELPHPGASAPKLKQFRLDSPKNTFQVFRRYYAADFPSHDPDEGLPSTYFSDVTQPGSSLYAPYPNGSSFLLGEWFWKDGGQKSLKDFNDLLRVLGHPDFSLDDIQHTRWNFINRQLGSLEEDAAPWLNNETDAGWVQESITLTIPFHKQLKDSAGNKLGNKPFQAGTFYCRSIVSVLRERLASADAHHFHYDPYELYWQPRPESDPIRLFGDLYTSSEFLRIHQELQDSPPEPGCTLPRVVIGLIFSSDLTHLTQFGDVKLWPVYLFFGNDSKYRRCKPSCHLCNHIAYLQAVGLASFFFYGRNLRNLKLPDTFDDFVTSLTGKTPSAAFQTHCHRQMFHEQWKVILDDEFMEAYLHGVVINCLDKVERRFYLRIFIYSSDYPEKCVYNLFSCLLFLT
jgi:Plavaka transposase